MHKKGSHLITDFMAMHQIHSNTNIIQKICALHSGVHIPIGVLYHTENLTLSSRVMKSVEKKKRILLEYLKSEQAHSSRQLKEDAVLDTVTPYLRVEHGDQAGQRSCTAARTHNDKHLICFA